MASNQTSGIQGSGVSSEETSASPWHTGGIFNPNSDPRVWIWTPTPPGMQSGDVVAKDVRPRDALLICAAPNMLAALRAVLDCWDSEGALTDAVVMQARIAAAKTDLG